LGELGTLLKQQGVEGTAGHSLLDFGGVLVFGSFFLFWAGAIGVPSSGTSRPATYTWSRELKFRHLAGRIFWESL